MIKQRKVLIEKHNPEYPVHAMDDWFRELLKDCHTSNMIILNEIHFINTYGASVMIQNAIFKTFWVKYVGIWQHFESNFNLVDYEQMEYFFQTRIELYFGLRGYKIV